MILETFNFLILTLKKKKFCLFLYVIVRINVLLKIYNEIIGKIFLLKVKAIIV